MFSLRGRSSPLVFAFVVALAGCMGSPSNEPQDETDGSDDEGNLSTGSSDRKPSRIEAEIAIDMGELYFADGAGAKGGVFRAPATKLVGIHVRNTGEIDHEIMFGQVVTEEDGAPHGFETTLFATVPADVFVYMPAKVEIETEGMLQELEVEKSGDVWIRASFPETTKGTWEIACFVPGHYEAGMKATLVIE
ncbi:MAG TPA: hypothetical protein VI997_06815 [Candidatus Thermoplasmatota archaeon]|nr:hypothetical protein [Candidatus Thermoplasmatota archaeon]